MAFPIDLCLESCCDPHVESDNVQVPESQLRHLCGFQGHPCDVPLGVNSRCRLPGSLERHRVEGGSRLSMLVDELMNASLDLPCCFT